LNASQHGRAHHIDINLVGTPEAIQLKVVDDGVGFDVAAHVSGSGLGLVSMRERARLVRGDFSIRSDLNQGTHIDVRVPLAGHAP
jgi:signal transduction histidine kinase